MTTLAITPIFGSTTHRHLKVKKATHRIHGQRTIDAQRASEIQGALIRQKYMNGEPTGQWDTQTQAAMQQYQSDHGWQTKLMPDSRALISLGLGPTHSNNLAPAPAPAQQPEKTTEAQSNEPAANTLASVHSLTQ